MLSHHELRAPVAWPEGCEPPEEVQDSLHGVWDRGVLHVGKYQSFHQDDRVGGFNPGHMAKWTPHELLHRAVGYFWRADATDWEHCIGARANEVLPVVLWYGLDQMGRDGGARFDRARHTSRPQVTEDDVRWVDAADDDATLTRDAERLDESLTHWASERAALAHEVATSCPHPVVHAHAPELDASSDAIAYVFGHRNRLRDAGLVRLHERILVDGLHYRSTLDALLARMDEVWDALLFEDLTISPSAWEARRDAVRLLDLAARAAMGGRAAFRPVASMASEMREALLAVAQSEDTGEWVRDVEERLRAALPVALTAQGLRGAPSPASLDHLRAGIASLAPCVAASLDEAALRRFATSEGFWSRASLAERLDAFLAADGASRALRDLLTFESALARLHHEDTRLALLSVDADEVPEWEDADGALAVHGHLEVLRVTTDVVEHHGRGGVPPDAGEVADALVIAIALRDEQAIVVDVPASVGAWLEAHRGRILPVTDALASLGGERDGFRDSTPGDWLYTLIESGLAGYIPSVASGSSSGGGPG